MTEYTVNTTIQLSASEADKLDAALAKAINDAVHPAPIGTRPTWWWASLPLVRNTLREAVGKHVGLREAIGIVALGWVEIIEPTEPAEPATLRITQPNATWKDLLDAYVVVVSLNARGKERQP